MTQPSNGGGRRSRGQERREHIVTVKVPATQGTPDEDPFIPEVAGALLAAGFPPERIGWLALPAPMGLALAAAMGSTRTLGASRP
jgi:hypothetical protein